jgi:eukaryotic-like serine/threonine-protein kinase
LIAGRYTRGREIGRGGMGAVWLGRDDVLGRDVALKRIGMVPGASAPDFDRAEREARLAARLNHPHVVAVYDLVDEGEDHWLVMEYVEGVTLSALVARDGALTPDEAAGLIRQAADALAAAHAAGIVHRDVKPSNMLVTPSGDVKLSDFGIARAEADSTLTQTGLVTGSPAYLAPEVASGSTATEASDVWSLGASLFHALAGRPPYDTSENLMGALYRIVHEDPPRLDDAGWLGPVLEHTMTREPNERWTMAQVRDYLDRGRDVALHPAPLVEDPATTTQVLEPTPAQPVAVPPVVADPVVVPPPEPAATPLPEGGRRRRGAAWPWVAAVVGLVAAVVIAFAALTSGNGNQNPAAGGPTSRSTTPSSRGSTSGAPRAAAMDRFVSTYLSTVTSDQHTTWGMLTRGFQKQSGGFGSYQGFWRTIASATPSNVSADPASLTVSYDVAYVRRDGTQATDHTTLHLVRNGTSYLIAGES